MNFSEILTIIADAISLDIITISLILSQRSTQKSMYKDAVLNFKFK